MDRVRVLIVSWEYPPIVEGGLGRHVRKLAENLVQQGTEVHVLTRGAREHAREEVRAGVVVHRVAEPPFPKGDLEAFVGWVERMNGHMEEAGRVLCERFAFDVLHGHDWLVAKACHALAREGGRDRIPYLTTIHATEFGRHQGWVGKHPQSYIHRIETRMAKRADGVICCSHYMRGHVADVFGLDEARVEVIPNGIDPDDLVAVDDLAALRARFAAPDERLVLLIGRLVYEKGFQVALDAMSRIRATRLGEDVRFLVAGSGTHEAELKRQAEALGLTEHGTFLGWIGDDVLHSLYRIADLCVVPSLYEPFGIVALEAMASGVPCIVADTGGLREVVPNFDVGLRFRGGSARHLATMMETLLSDDDLRDRLVTEASEHVLSFDWADVARQTRAVYDRLDGRERGSAAVDVVGERLR